MAASESFKYSNIQFWTEDVKHLQAALDSKLTSVIGIQTTLSIEGDLVVTKDMQLTNGGILKVSGDLRIEQDFSLHSNARLIVGGKLTFAPGVRAILNSNVSADEIVIDKAMVVKPDNTQMQSNRLTLTDGILSAINWIPSIDAKQVTLEGKSNISLCTEGSRLGGADITVGEGSRLFIQGWGGVFPARVHVLPGGEMELRNTSDKQDGMTFDIEGTLKLATDWECRGKFNIAKGGVMELVSIHDDMGEFRFNDKCVIDGTVKGDPNMGVSFPEGSQINGTVELKMQ